MKVERILTQIKAKPAEDDPVLDGLIREFRKFGESLKTLYDGVGKFTQALDQSCHGTMSMIDTFSKTLSKSGNYIASDMVKYKEACNNITREDAPFSTIAKFKRDLSFNVIEPLRKHIGHYHVLLDRIERRHRLLAELRVSRQSLESHVEDNAEKLTKADFDKVASLFNDFKSAEKLFNKENTNLLEWMLMISAYQEDIYDSLIQTVKCLQYEFLAGAARNVACVLPKTMEFRPLMEMTPENLLPQVQIAMMAREEKAKAKGIDHSKLQTTTRILELFQNSDSDSESQMPSNSSVIVDPLSLSLLLAQGFDEELVRKALKLKNNDTQAALDWLLNPVVEVSQPEPALGNVSTSVRMPKTGKLMEKLRAYEEKRRARLAKQTAEAESEQETANSTDTDEAVRVLKEVNVEAMLSEATPQQTKKRSRRRKHHHHQFSSSESAHEESSNSSSSSWSSRSSSSSSSSQVVERTRKRSRAKRRHRHSRTDSISERRSKRKDRKSNREKGTRAVLKAREARSSSHRKTLITTSSSEEEIPGTRKHKRQTKAQRSFRQEVDIREKSFKKQDEELVKPPASVPGDHQQANVRVFEPSPIPLMLSELLPIGGTGGKTAEDGTVPERNKKTDAIDDEAGCSLQPDSNSLPLEEFRDLLFETSSSSSDGADANDPLSQ